MEESPPDAFPETGAPLAIMNRLANDYEQAGTPRCTAPSPNPSISPNRRSAEQTEVRR
jgi:hypothetical protein